jgi:hypothetical protein
MKAIAGAFLRDAKRRAAMDDKSTAETVQRVATAAREAADTGFECAGVRESWLRHGQRDGGNLNEFVRKEPWIAIAAAFAAGYVVAQVMRRISA